MNWKNFKTDPPYDAYEDDHNGLETDYIYAWFIYRYKYSLEGETFLSYQACQFSQGIFNKYKIGMKTSSYLSDHIEVLYWVEDREVKNLVLTDFRKS